MFSVRGTDIYIGGEKVTDALRGVLRDEARYIQGSRLWELFNNAVINEAATLALLQSTEWEQVKFAKALHHWGHVFRNTLFTLQKD